jgi:hypothetical protein
LDDNNNIIKAIEYDGEQHFYPVERFGGEKAFIKQKIRDSRKTEFCNTHNIFLQRIPYTDYDNITLEMLLENTPYLENEKIFGEGIVEQKPNSEISQAKSQNTPGDTL